MLNKFLTKLKASKTPRFYLDGQIFNTANLVFKLSPRYFRLPGFGSSKLFQFISSKILSLQTSGLRLNRHNISAAFRRQEKRLKKFVDRRTIAASIASSFVLYFAYEYNPYMTRIFLSYDHNKFNQKLVSCLSSLYNAHFYPSLYCTTPLLQSIMNKAPPESAVRYNREPVLLPDGGQIMLDWALPVKQVEYVGTPVYGKYYPYQPPKENKIMFILHGLTGGSETNYIQSIVENARRKGYRVVVMNQRGVNQPLLTPVPFHGGTLHDLEAGLAYVRSKYPDAPIVTVGTSFGGNQLIRYLGQEGNKATNNIVAGVLLAAPFDIDDCVDQIQNTVYEDFFIRNYLEKNFLPNMDMFMGLRESHDINIEDILKVRNLRDYHSLFTVKLYDHKNVREYFETSKVQASHINNVKVPLLVLHAKDDPIAVHKSIPIDTLRKNSNIIFAETNRGSHLCWFTGLKAQRWYSKPTIEFLDKVLEIKQSEKRESMVQ